MEISITDEEFIDGIGCLLNACCLKPFSIEETKEFIPILKDVLLKTAISSNSESSVSSFKKLVTILYAHEVVDRKDCLKELYGFIFDILGELLSDEACDLLSIIDKEEVDTNDISGA